MSQLRRAPGVAVTLWFMIHEASTVLRRPPLQKLMCFYNYLTLAATPAMLDQIRKARSSLPAGHPGASALDSLLHFLCFLLPLVHSTLRTDRRTLCAGKHVVYV